MRLAAVRAALRTASATASGGPTNVYTVRFVPAPGSPSSRLTAGVLLIEVAIASTTERFRPSEKFGTHSTSRGIVPIILRIARDQIQLKPDLTWDCRIPRLSENRGDRRGGPVEH